MTKPRYQFEVLEFRELPQFESGDRPGWRRRRRACIDGSKEREQESESGVCHRD
jgi:hypothetical protein